MEKLQNKTKTIKIRLTPEDKTDWELKAEAGGFSLSELARKAVSRIKIWKLKDRTTEKSRILQMARINNNLREITRQIEIYKFGTESKIIIDSLEEIKKELKIIKNSLIK